MPKCQRRPWEGAAARMPVVCGGFTSSGNLARRARTIKRQEVHRG